MRYLGIFVGVIALLFIFPFASASLVDDVVSDFTEYVGQYEDGDLTAPELVVYLESALSKTYEVKENIDVSDIERKMQAVDHGRSNKKSNYSGFQEYKKEFITDDFKIILNAFPNMHYSEDFYESRSDEKEGTYTFGFYIEALEIYNDDAESLFNKFIEKLEDITEDEDDKSFDFMGMSEEFQNVRSAVQFEASGSLDNCNEFLSNIMIENIPDNFIDETLETEEEMNENNDFKYNKKDNHSKYGNSQYVLPIKTIYRENCWQDQECYEECWEEEYCWDDYTYENVCDEQCEENCWDEEQCTECPDPPEETCTEVCDENNENCETVCELVPCEPGCETITNCEDNCWDNCYNEPTSQQQCNTKQKCEQKCDPVEKCETMEDGHLAVMGDCKDHKQEEVFPDIYINSWGPGLDHFNELNHNENKIDCERRMEGLIRIREVFQDDVDNEFAKWYF